LTGSRRRLVDELSSGEEADEGDEADQDRAEPAADADEVNEFFLSKICINFF